MGFNNLNITDGYAGHFAELWVSFEPDPIFKRAMRYS